MAWSRRTAFLLLAVAATGCKPAARAAFNRMHEAACAGDAATLIAQVAEEKLVDNWMDHGRAVPPSRAHATLEEWKADVPQSKGHSAVCSWSFVSFDRRKDRVEVTAENGDRIHLYFSKVDGRMKLVNLQVLEPKTDAQSQSKAK